MSITTTTDIQGGYYGKWVGSKKNPIFVSYGKAATLEEILESIETQILYWKLSTPHFGRRKTAYITQGDIHEPKLGKDLSNLGFDIPPYALHSFVDSLRLQYQDIEQANIPPTTAYASLGWIKIPSDDPSAGIPYQLSYRCSRLVGTHQQVKYIGPYYIEPVGKFSNWKQLVLEDVLPYPALQFVLVAALSAVIVGLLAISSVPIENPIVHLYLPSGKGKSTAGYLATSTVGKPYDSSMPFLDDDGRLVERQSLYQSWGATDNAMIATQAGNRGVVTVLNELGKSLTNNMTRLIYDLSEGSDKKRLTKDCQPRVSEGYSTTFISTGESSLLEKCHSKLEGLAVRVMEISRPLTKDAEHAGRIKDCCSTNCSFAAPRLANYIIKQGGIDYVLPRYKYWVTTLRQHFPATPNKDRFVEKFAALFMVTAEIATDALKIPFNMDSLLTFLDEYDQEHGAERNVAISSYDLLIEYCNIHADKFYRRYDKKYPKTMQYEHPISAPIHDCWGRITYMSIPQDNGTVLCKEYEIRPSVVAKFLKDNGFDSRKTCTDAWVDAGVLYCEDKQHATRTRKIDPTAPAGKGEEVYVLRVFAISDDATELLAEIKKQEDKAAIIRNRKKLKCNMLHINADSNTEEVNSDANHA